MADKKTLRPQMPGAAASPDPLADASLAPLFELDDVDVISGLSALDNAELARLAELNDANHNRRPIANAIKAEQTKRTEVEDAGYTKEVDPSLPHALPPPPASPPESIYGTPGNLGDAVTYSKWRQNQIDASKLTGPVLSLDGWVIPDDKPRPQPVVIVPNPDV